MQCGFVQMQWAQGTRAPLHRLTAARKHARAAPCSKRPSTRYQAVETLDVVQSRFMQDLQFINDKWASVKSEQQFLEALSAEVAAGRCPKQIVPLWQDFYKNYRNAVVNSGAPGANEQLAASVQATIADTVLNQFINSYTFPPLHKRIMEPYNYFEFGQRYVGTLIDFDNSLLGNPDIWAEVAGFLEQKHNVVLLANHQTEADPGVFAHMLIDSHPSLATEVTYVAGDRVVSDPLCKPFSMGRNLFCVHSKKHMNDVPELKAAKMETNRKTLVAMARRLAEGGCLLWIAPSGGRDRPNIDDEWFPDKFDPAAVKLMRDLLVRPKHPGHLYPMAMFSWPVMPPPKSIDKTLGERRLTNYSGVGISIAPELQVEEVLSAIAADDKEQQQEALAQAGWEAVTTEYVNLVKAINDPAYRQSKAGQYAQPWNK